MSAPNNNGGRQERSAYGSSWPTPQPGFQPPTYPSYTHNPPEPQYSYPAQASYAPLIPSTEFRPIRAVREHTYLPESRMEDIGSHLYTLNMENQFEPTTTTYEPAAHWNPHQAWVPNNNGPNYSQPQPYQSMPTGYENVHNAPPLFQPANPNSSRRMRTPETLPVAGSSTGFGTQSYQHGGRRESPRSETKGRGKGKQEWICEECGTSPFFRKAEYDRHISTSKAHQGQKSHHCSKCGRGFSRGDAALRHERLCGNQGGSQRHRSYGSDESGVF